MIRSIKDNDSLTSVTALNRIVTKLDAVATLRDNAKAKVKTKQTATETG